MSTAVKPAKVTKSAEAIPSLSLGNNFSQKTTVNPFEYFTFADTLDYRLKFVHNRGAVIEGRPTKRLVNFNYEEFYLQLPWMYYFFKPSSSNDHHLKISRIAGRWTKMRTVNDKLFCVPLPNLYGDVPCYYPERIVNPIYNMFFYDYALRNDGYPSFEMVAHSNLKHFWHTHGNTDGSDCHDVNTKNCFLRSVYREFLSLSLPERTKLLKKSGFESNRWEANQAEDVPATGRDIAYAMHDEPGVFRRFLMWENKTKPQLMKYSYKPTGSLKSLVKLDGATILTNPLLHSR